MEPRVNANSDHAVTTPKSLTGRIAQVFSTMPNGRGWATFPFNTITLTSRYQPIISADQQRPIGYEATVVGKNLSGHALQAETVFRLSANHDEALFVDWLTRALHLRNFANMGDDRGTLFLNAYPAAALADVHQPDGFARVLDFYNAALNKLVIEIKEGDVADEAALAEAVKLYRTLGCKIAIDNVGVGAIRFEQIRELRPDFVKIDSSMIRAAAQFDHERIALAEKIRRLRRCGVPVVVKGIENVAEAKLALDMGADYLQGFLFARPGNSAMKTGLATSIFTNLFSADPMERVLAS